MLWPLISQPQFDLINYLDTASPPHLHYLLKTKIKNKQTNTLLYFFQDHPEDLPEFEEKTGVSIRQIKEPVLSVIIPVLNEANNILETLNNVIKVSYKFLTWLDFDSLPPWLLNYFKKKKKKSP